MLSANCEHKDVRAEHGLFAPNPLRGHGHVARDLLRSSISSTDHSRWFTFWMILSVYEPTRTCCSQQGVWTRSRHIVTLPSPPGHPRGVNHVRVRAESGDTSINWMGGPWC